jgi:hypothetical protein
MRFPSVANVLRSSWAASNPQSSLRMDAEAFPYRAGACAELQTG